MSGKQKTQNTNALPKPAKAVAGCRKKQAAWREHRTVHTVLFQLHFSFFLTSFFF